MLKDCSKEVLRFLKETERSEEYNDIRCFIKEENKFNIHIFMSISKNAHNLKRNWRMFNNDLAWHFQSKLKSKIERWNLYIIYFVKNEVGKDLKYEIEQDKYCARKIVVDKFDEENNQEKIKSIINEKLFKIKLGIQLGSDSDNLVDIIQENDKYLLELINKGLKDEEILDKYLMGGQNED